MSVVYTEKIVEKIVEVPVERIVEKIVHVNVDRVVEATTASEDITYELKQLRSRSKYNQMQALYESARKERDTAVAQLQSLSSAAELVKDELQLNVDVCLCMHTIQSASMEPVEIKFVN